jgi:hypothetical protein
MRLEVRRLPTAVFVYCNGAGNHGHRRQLFPMARNHRVLIRCELCQKIWAQREDRWHQIVQVCSAIDQRELDIDSLPNHNVRR